MSDKEWSDEEFEAAVYAYLEMLILEQNGEEYKKSSINEALRKGKLSGRSRSSIEFRMQNISAVLEEIGRPRIKGYAPAKNIGARGTEKIKAAILKLDADSSTYQVQLKTLTVKDLPYPVNAAKSDWSPADGWVGFTPTGTGPNAYAQCQSTISHQINNGYIIEYITKSIQQPNEGFENDSSYLETLAEHPAVAGRVIAIHKPRASARPLEQILGEEAYEHMQDVWSQRNKRVRWSVAFPIVESYKIVDPPLIKDILSEESYKSLIQRSSATLRELSDEDRDAIANLEIVKIETRNSWIAIEDEIRNAELSEINPDIFDLITADFPTTALEGETEERKLKVKKRAAWLAERFAKRRARENTLKCDHCDYDPKLVLQTEAKYHRSLLDVHHTDPVSEGVRYTTENDFELLCPNCHRLEHVKMRIDSNA